MSGKPFVFVLDKDKKPLMPCTGKRARLLLERGRARVVRIRPFTIQLKDREQATCELQDIEIKIDPGSKFTGICTSRTQDGVVNVLNLIELEHRGQQISQKLKARAIWRRARRNRNTRYRPARFLNRTKPKGWLPPSLQHRVDTTMSWINRLCRWLPITSLAFERVRFDMQQMQNPEISGIEYQQGTLAGYEVREYVLARDGHKCAYCGASCTTHRLEIDHVKPRYSGGSNRISNLVTACRQCNQAKGKLPIEIFLAKKPEILKRVLAQLKKSLKDAAAVSAARNALFKAMLNTGLPVAIGTGAQTSYNRSWLNIPKTHALDAACVGGIKAINNWLRPHLGIKCTGRGQYQRTKPDKYGFPRLYFPRVKRIFGFATGDIVKATTRKSKQLAEIIGKVIVRTTGNFEIKIINIVYNCKWFNCKILQLTDGYYYTSKNYEYIKINTQIVSFLQFK